MLCKSNQAGFTLIETMISLAVFLIIIGTAFSSVSSMILAATASDYDLLVVTENQRAMTLLKYDILSSSRNQVQERSPKVVGNELRFRVVIGFDTQGKKSAFSKYYVCYWLDDTQEPKLLKRCFRRLDPPYQKLTEAPAKYPGATRKEADGSVYDVISIYCEDFDPDTTTHVDAGLVVITITNEIGEPSDIDYAHCQTEFHVMPFNSE